MPSTLIVIGAGLAGSAVAARLAREGWTVTVLDAAREPAQGASSLPVGLMAPMISRQDTAAARLTREGVRATLDECARLTQAGALHEGIDWQRCEVIQRSLSGTPRSRQAPPPDWPADNPWIRPHGDCGSDWRHLQAAWIKPAALVRAWLATPGVLFVGNAAVAGLERRGDTWHALDASGQSLASASQLVIAAAVGTNALLQSLDSSSAAQGPRLSAVAGQVAYAPWTTPMQAALDPCLPRNGNGHFIPNVPHLPNHQGQGVAGAWPRLWLSGSTYEHEPWADPATRRAEGLHANIERAGPLLPPAVQALIEAQRAQGEIQVWQSVRCTSPTRLPVVQSLGDGLHICTAMGSRGLTFAWLSAQQLLSALRLETTGHIQSRDSR